VKTQTHIGMLTVMLFPHNLALFLVILYE